MNECGKLFHRSKTTFKSTLNCHVSWDTLYLLDKRWIMSTHLKNELPRVFTYFLYRSWGWGRNFWIARRIVRSFKGYKSSYKLQWFSKNWVRGSGSVLIKNKSLKILQFVSDLKNVNNRKILVLTRIFSIIFNNYLMFSLHL